MLKDKLEATKNALREDIRKALAHKDQELAQESTQRGKNARKTCPRSSHGSWQPAPERPNPVQLLKDQGKTRVQDLLPIRYERMAVSPFTFFRGGALIMAHDLSNTPNTGFDVQICGDAHVANFGLFQSPERHLIFDLNDFDETNPGPWEWDVKRLAASIEICGRDRTFSEQERQKAVMSAAQGYRQTMQKFAHMGTMDVWYAHIDVEEIYEQFANQLPKQERKYTEKIITKAKAKNATRAVSKFTEVTNDKLHFISDPPLIVPAQQLAEQYLNKTIENPNLKERESLIALILRKYRLSLSDDKRLLLDRYHGIDIARKVVGVGSVGTRCWMVLLEGADFNDPLVLQIKEANESVCERFTKRSRYLQHGQRVVEGQRALQATSDVLLGWAREKGLDGKPHDYYLRQLWDGKGSIDLDTITPDRLNVLARVCGGTLARAHARTGNRFAIAAYLGKSDTFDIALAQFAVAYAEQNEKDYEQFMDAYSSGALFNS